MKVKTNTFNSSEAVKNQSQVNLQAETDQKVNLSAKEVLQEAKLANTSENTKQANFINHDSKVVSGSSARASPVEKVQGYINQNLDKLHDKRMDQYSSKLEKAIENAKVTKFGKHIEQTKNGEFISKVGFYKSDEKIKVGQRNIRQHGQKYPFEKSLDHISNEARESEQEFGQEGNKKAHDILSNVYHNDIKTGIANSRIGFDRRLGNVARANIKLHNEKTLGQLREKLRDDNLSKKEKKKLKKQHKIQRKKYAIEAYKKEGLRKLSLKNIGNSAIGAFNPFQGTIQVFRNSIQIVNQSISILKSVWTAISFMFSFLINTVLALLGTIPLLGLILLPIILVITFIWIFPGEENPYVLATELTNSVQERLTKMSDDWTNYVVNKTIRFPSSLASEYDEIKSVNAPTLADFDNNKMINFLSAYFGEEYSYNKVESLLEEYIAGWKIVDDHVEIVKGTCLVFVPSKPDQCLQKEKDKTILYVRWETPSMDQWMNEKINLLSTDKKELFLAKKEYYDQGYGFAQIFDSPFGIDKDENQIIHKVTSPFGCRMLRGEIDCSHYGIDIAGNTGDALYSVGNGYVEGAGSDHTGGGNTVIIRYETSEGTFIVAYAHLSEILVSQGQTVDKSTIIGKVGSTGNSTGPHLHIECWKDKRWSGKQINPIYIINLTNK